MKNLFFFSTLQGRGDPVKKDLMLLLTEEPKFFIFLGTQLVELGEEGHARLNIVIEANKAEGHQNSPPIRVQLDDW